MAAIPFLLNNWKYLAMVGLVAVAAFYRWDAQRWEAKYETYVAEVAAVAAVAEAKAKETEARDKKKKEVADAKASQALAAVRDANKRLRDEIAGRGILSSPAPGSADPGRATFDRAELDRALRDFATGAAELVREGDEARAGLNGAREWARDPH